jgi:hypothetical protein
MVARMVEQTWISLILGTVSQIRRATFLWHKDISLASLYIVNASRNASLPGRPHTFRPFNTGRIWDLHLKKAKQQDEKNQTIPTEKVRQIC